MNDGEAKYDPRDQVIAELQRRLKETQQELQEARRRIGELEEELGKSPTPKVEESFSVDAEEARQNQRGRKVRSRKRPKPRRGRKAKAEKIKQAVRTEKIFPAGIPEDQCKLSHTRPVLRIEDGRAVWVAYDIYRGPRNQYGEIPRRGGTQRVWDRDRADPGAFDLCPGLIL